MKKITLISIITLFGIIGCASKKLLSLEERKSVHIIHTINKQNINYVRVLTRISRAYLDSNYAIKVKDKESGTIVSKGRIKCQNMKKWNTDAPWLAFDMTINFKESRVRILFEDLVVVSKRGKIIHSSSRQLKSQDMVEKAKKCLETEVKGMLVKALDSKDDW